MYFYSYRKVEMPKNRIQWMDFTRGICMLLVIFVHCSVAVKDEAGLYFSDSITAFNEFMDPFRMPLLMFLSGMLLNLSLKKPFNDYISGKFNLIFWPFLVWSMAVYAAEGRLTLEYILKTPISAPSVMWYLWFLFAFYLVSFALDRTKISVALCAIFCILLSAILPSALRIDRFAYLYSFFLMGHIASCRMSLSDTPTWIGLTGALAAATGGFISAKFGSIKYDPVYIWAPIGLIFLVLWLSRFYSNNPSMRMIEWIGRNSIVFYCTHFPAILISCWAFARTGWFSNGTYLYVCTFLMTVIVGIVFQWLRFRIVFIRALFDFRLVSSALFQK